VYPRTGTGSRNSCTVSVQKENARLRSWEALMSLLTVAASSPLYARQNCLDLASRRFPLGNLPYCFKPLSRVASLRLLKGSSWTLGRSCVGVRRLTFRPSRAPLSDVPRILVSLAGTLGWREASSASSYPRSTAGDQSYYENHQDGEHHVHIHRKVLADPYKAAARSRFCVADKSLIESCPTVVAPNCVSNSASYEGGAMRREQTRVHLSLATMSKVQITLTTTNTTNPIRIHCSGVGDFQLIRHPLPLMYPLT
jgi:hypothetical protein